MASVKDWLNQKFRDWEKSQGKAQSYYAFARYLEVSQSGLSSWMAGTSEPDGEELNTLAVKLGPEIYRVMGTQPLGRAPGSDDLAEAWKGIPAGLRERLSDAVVEVDQVIREHSLAPDSLEAKKLAVEIFNRRGIRLTN